MSQITSSKKQNVRCDQSSLSFRVGYCQRQVIDMDTYMTGIYRNNVQKVIVKIGICLHQNIIHKLKVLNKKTKTGYGQTTFERQIEYLKVTSLIAYRNGSKKVFFFFLRGQIPRSLVLKEKTQQHHNCYLYLVYKYYNQSQIRY